MGAQWKAKHKDIAANGTNDPEVERRNEKTFLEWSPRIHDEPLRRAWAAGSTQSDDVNQTANCFKKA